MKKTGQLVIKFQSKIVDDEDYYILLDEVQLLEDFEEVLNSLLHISNADIYVTGSNSKFLSKDILTEFRGRGDEIHVFPLTFKEFLSRTSFSQAGICAMFIRY
jgi:predicted AAA+ superfamily ATPase